MKLQKTATSYQRQKLILNTIEKKKKKEKKKKDLLDHLPAEWDTDQELA